jgi:hypothetical protein
MNKRKILIKNPNKNRPNQICLDFFHIYLGFLDFEYLVLIIDNLRFDFIVWI